MKVQGSCHCSKITYAADVDPGKVIVCSCINSAASVPAPAGSFQLHSGDPTRFVGVAESGAIRLDCVCASCGSVIYSSAATEPQKFWLYTSWVKERSELRPKKMIHCRLACGKLDMREPPRGMDRSDLSLKLDEKMLGVSSNAALLRQSRRVQEWSRALHAAVRRTTAESHAIIANSKTILKLSEGRIRKTTRK